jgi:sporulation integral membrane protein YtvI
MPFIVGFLIAFALAPIARFIQNTTKIKGKSISIFVLAAFYVLVFIILWFISSLLWAQTYDLIKLLPNFYFTNMEPILFSFNDWIVAKAGTISPDIASTASDIIVAGIQNVSSGIKSLSVSLIQFTTSLISNFPLYLISIVFTIVLSIFISVELDDISAFLKKQLPDNFNKTFEEVRKFLFGTLLKMVKAYLIILSITFVELLIGLSILKVTYALPIAAIVSVLDILPILGTGGVLIPWAIVNLISNDYRSGFGMLILYFTMLIVRNAVEPRIVGHEIGLHPIITITTMYAGLRLFGFIGFIIAPLVTILVKYLNDQGEINLYKK